MMTTKNLNQIEVGDRVQFTWGTSLASGTVVEDRGPIGSGKVHIFRISVPNDPYDDDVFEMPEDEIKVINQDVAAKMAIRPDEATEYLSRGGLVQILRAGMSGGKNQPRAWLCRDSLGNVTHTFSPERSGLGGNVVPFFVLRDGRVFVPKREEVRSFLRGFGINDGEIDHVLESVGAAT